MNRARYASVGGIIYLILGVFAAAVLYMWLGGTSVSKIWHLLAVSGGAPLLGFPVFLSLASFSVGIYLLRCPPNPVLVILGLGMAIIAVLWGYMAAIIWLWPILFVWIGRPAHRDV